MSRITLPGEKQLTGSALLVSTDTPKKVLLVHHKKFNTWVQPGGHVEANENPLEAAVRETREETGIDISFLLQGLEKIVETTVLPLPAFFLEEHIPPHADQPAHYHLDHIYLVKVEEQAVQKQAAESHDIGWFTLEEALKLDLFENTKMMLRHALLP